MRLSPLRAALFGSVLIGASACAADSGTSPATSLDVGAALQQTSIAQLGSLPGVSGLLGLPQESAFPITVPASCNYASSSRSFVCPPVTASGITYQTSFFLYDASGAPQSSANLATTASVRALFDVGGSASLPFAGSTAPVAIHRHSDLTLSGLLANARVLNGTSTDHDTASVSGVLLSASAAFDLTTTAAAVTWPAGASTGYPASGTITIDGRSLIAIGSLPAASTPIHGVLTFSGGSIATLSGTVAGIPVNCRIDLSGATSPVCS